MLIKSFTGVTEISSLLFHKPVSQIVVVENFNYKDAIPYPQTNVPFARIRLVDGFQGSSSEVVPKMLLTHLSELSSKYEGFDIRAGAVSIEDDKYILSGRSIYTVVLGGISDNTGRFTCVDLSNQKYFDLELTGLNPKAKYEIYGIEGYEISSFVRKYSIMYLSRDEKQKNILTGENEILVLPLNGLDEVQFYPKNGKSFTLTRFELEHDAYRNNDIALVELTRGVMFNTDYLSKDVMSHKDSLITRDAKASNLKSGVEGGFDFDLAKSLKYGGVLDVTLGFEDLTVFPLVDIESFDIRRPAEVMNIPYTFYMVDTAPTR